VQSWKAGPWAPPFTFKSSQLVVYIYNDYRGKKGPEWDHVIIVEQKKENFQVQHKCRVVRILSSSEMCDKIGHTTKETPWTDTDYRSYFI